MSDTGSPDAFICDKLEPWFSDWTNEMNDSVRISLDLIHDRKGSTQIPASHNRGWGTRTGYSRYAGFRPRAH
ncbi:hypothetical protein FHT86_007300 [Rhizobium sp. BK313]|nr:hypothetical protein [Rhizobium sp. BK313]